jgi:hypothetical protein
MEKGILVALLALVLGSSPARGQAEDGGTDEASRRAEAAVARAACAVEAAARQRALWTTAREALRDAQAALARKDYVAAERLADFAQQQARLGVEQLSYPPFR